AATSMGFLSPIDTPPAKHQLATISEGMYWFGIDRDKQGKLRYSFGLDQNELQAPVAEIAPALTMLRKQIVKPGEARLRIRGDKKMPNEFVMDAMKELRRVEAELDAEFVRQKKGRFKLELAGEVSEPQ